MTTAPPPRRAGLRGLAIGLVALAALGAGLLSARYLVGAAGDAPRTAVAAVFRVPRPLPAFRLTAHDGTPFDASRLRGHYTFVLFGYTNCPDVCPTTLLELAHARRLLADLPPADVPAVVMVSVDPARDAPAQLAGYVPHFDPSFVGVTGSAAAIDALALALGVAIERGTPKDGSYAVDHTAAVFLIDPAARVAAVFPAPHVAQTLAADYRAIRRAGGA